MRLQNANSSLSEVCCGRRLNFECDSVLCNIAQTIETLVQFDDVIGAEFNYSWRFWFGDSKEFNIMVCVNRVEYLIRIHKRTDDEMVINRITFYKDRGEKNLTVQPFKYETVLSMIEYLQNMMISEGKRHEIAYKKKKIGFR